MNYSRNSRLNILLTLLVALAVAAPIWAQKPQPCPAPKANPARQTYRLEFTVQQLRAGRVINQRKYELLVASAAGYHWSQINVGNRVPVGRDKGETEYQDVGFGLRAQLTGPGPLLVHVSIDTLGPKTAADGEPVVRHISADISTAIRPNVPTVLATIADTGSNDQYRISLLAVPLQP